MKTSHLMFLFCICAFVSLNAKVIDKNSIKVSCNPIVAVNIIQVGMFKEQENIDAAVKRLSNYKTLIKPYNNLHIVYAVGIKTHKLFKTLKMIQMHYYDAFINKKMHIYDHAQCLRINVVVTIKEDATPKKVKKTEVLTKLPSLASNEKIKTEKTIKTVESAEPAEKMGPSNEVYLQNLLTSFEKLPWLIYGKI